MAGSKREKTKYPGVYYRMLDRLDGLGLERMYYIMYRRGGRGAKLIEEPVGRETEGMTAAKANKIRAMRAAGVEMSNTQRREQDRLERHVNAGTVDFVWNRYRETLPQNSNLATEISRFNKYIAPTLGDKPLSDLVTRDVENIKSKMQKAGYAPQTIKHATGLLARILNYGVAHGLCLRPDPAVFQIVPPKVDNQKTEVLTDKQLEDLITALDEEEDQDAAALIRLALVTGMRKGALLALRWDDCDFERGIITLRGEAAKKRKTEYIPMNGAARRILEGITRTSDFVFPGRNGGQRSDYRRIARRVKKKANLPEDFRPLHGLRHNYASQLASSGQVDLYMLQKLLTHSSPQMTQRYAHLHDQALKRAAGVADNIFSDAARVDKGEQGQDEE